MIELCCEYFSVRCIWPYVIMLRTCQSKEFLDIQATIECRFTLKRVRYIIITYSQMHRTEKYSQHSSIIWPIWLNSWMFVYELSVSGFKSRYCHLNLRFVPVSSKEFLDIQATIESRFTLKRVFDMIITSVFFFFYVSIFRNKEHSSVRGESQTNLFTKNVKLTSFLDRPHPAQRRHMQKKTRCKNKKFRKKNYSPRNVQLACKSVGYAWDR